MKFLYSLVNIFVCTVFAFQLIIEVGVRSEEKLREMLSCWLCVRMCIVFAFQLIRAKEVRIDIEVKRSEEK